MSPLVFYLISSKLSSCIISQDSGKRHIGGIEAGGSVNSGKKPGHIEVLFIK